MVVETNRRGLRTIHALRLLALLPISMLVGHEAVFALQFGLGDALRNAMTAGGHDGYWTAFSVVVAALTGGFLIREAARAVGVRARLARIERRGGDRNHSTAANDKARRSDDGQAPSGPTWRREFRGLFPLLFALTSVGFTIQENLEHIAAGQAPHGLGSLFGTEHPFAILVLAVVSGAVGALGALLRWRIRILEVRLARAVAAARPTRPRPVASSPAAEWPPVGALRAHAWFLVRLLAGRAPPSVA